MLSMTLCLLTMGIREKFLTVGLLRTELYKSLEEKTLSLPQPVPLNRKGKRAPYFFIGDDALL